VNEADGLPARDQRRLPRKDGPEQGQMRFVGIDDLRIVPRARVVGQSAERRLILVRRCPLHGADANMAGSDAREHRPLEHRFAIDRLPRRDHRKAARRRNAEGVHRLADDVFPQHRAERCAAISAA
jgi:hypothetical protein